VPSGCGNNNLIYGPMIKLNINNTEIEAETGTSILEAAELVGIKIPNMCHNSGLEHFTSCMLCLVRDISENKLIPACVAKVRQDMQILTDDKEIQDLRQMAVELLLSEHTGDCEAPCRIACPAFMNIPLMNRLIATGNMKKALEVVKKDIALPGVLGRICPAPCEKACKRAAIDEAVSVCLLKRFSFDKAGDNIEVVKTECGSKKAAVIGAGPAGLSAAYFLQINGIQTTVYDKNEMPGGALRYDIPDTKLDKSVLDKEVENILKTGAIIKQNAPIDTELFAQICKEYDAVVIATGNYEPSMDAWDLENNGQQIIIDKTNYQTGTKHVFAIGNANRQGQLAIRSAAQGKEVAYVIAQLFKGEALRRENRGFNSSTGKTLEAEFVAYMKEASNDARQFPEIEGSGFSEKAAQKEAARCMHCDCRKQDNCKLRFYAEKYNVSKKRFAFTQRKPLIKNTGHSSIIYEEGKCIKCGICVRMTAMHKETFGFTFIGRGFDVKIAVPFNEQLDKALTKTAIMVADACPTGALAKIED